MPHIEKTIELDPACSIDLIQKYCPFKETLAGKDQTVLTQLLNDMKNMEKNKVPNKILSYSNELSIDEKSNKQQWLIKILFNPENSSDKLCYQYCLGEGDNEGKVDIKNC